MGVTRKQKQNKGLIFPPSEPHGEIMSFGVSPVNYSDSDSVLKDEILEFSKRISEFCSILVLSPLWAAAVTWSDYSRTCSKRLECNLNMIPFTVINCRHLFLYFHFTLSQKTETETLCTNLFARLSCHPGSTEMRNRLDFAKSS